MTLNIIVKEKRKELGLTQEQVANYLGVSTPAVSKWESGATYPDVFLLPALARLLQTDLNTLMCFNEELSHKEIGLFMNKVTEIANEEGFEQGLTFAMEKVHEYPDSVELLNSVAILLQGLMIMTECSMEQKEKCDAYKTQLYERVAKSNDSKFSDSAKYMLVSKLIGTKEYDRAQDILNELQEYNGFDKRNLQAQLWMKQGKNSEAAGILERKLMSNLQDNQSALNSLAKIAIQEGDEQNAICLAQCAQKEVELFKMWEYSKYVVTLQVAISRKDVESSISTLKSMLNEILIPWDMKKSPICKHIQNKEDGKKFEKFGKKFLPSVLMELEKSSEYDFLRSVPEFEQLLELYKAKC